MRGPTDPDDEVPEGRLPFSPWWLLLPVGVVVALLGVMIVGMQQSARINRVAETYVGHIVEGRMDAAYALLTDERKRALGSADRLNLALATPELRGVSGRHWLETKQREGGRACFVATVQIGGTERALRVYLQSEGEEHRVHDVVLFTAKPDTPPPAGPWPCEESD